MASMQYKSLLLLVAMLVIALASCTTYAPVSSLDPVAEMPAFATAQQQACADTCQSMHSCCERSCESRAQYREQAEVVACQNNCRTNLKQCYNSCR